VSEEQSILIAGRGGLPECILDTFAIAQPHECDQLLRAGFVEIHALLLKQLESLVL
jgi:hypothetical protein